MKDSLMSFYKGKKVLITGHMGFKGTWLCEMLEYLGADVYGYGLLNDVCPSIFEISNTKKRMTSYEGDIRNLDLLLGVFKKTEPEIVFHLAAQPIVLAAYDDPVYTYSTNVLGTVNLMECVRLTPSVKSVINITTDKVYRNLDRDYAFVEEDVLDGNDPYANSKSCSELVTASYKRSFFKDRDIAVSCLRAGNVVGGGDFSDKRIIPDCIRAQEKDGVVELRNPSSIRPFQHVLEALYAYVVVAMEQYKDIDKQGCYNIGPKPENSITTGELAEIFCKEWKENASWKSIATNGPKEAALLRLDCTKLEKVFGLRPTCTIEEAIKMVVYWHKKYNENKDMHEIFVEQIEAFLEQVSR